tara:strand:+ start:33028 stop:34140 length:1113 start_codon:yes stop_codon:yes gene_type:complete
MRKLNIFFSNSISSQKWGGGEKWMVTAANGLKMRGHNTILSGKANSEFLLRAQNAGLKTLPLNIYADYNPLKIWHTKKILEKHSIDVIVLNLNKDIRVAGIAARLAKVPVIIARNGIQLFSNKWKYKKTISIVDGIITNSKSIQNAYNEFPWMNKKKTTVIYNGLKLRRSIDVFDIRKKWNIEKDSLVFVAAGRLTRQKGFDLLIEAVSKVKNRTKAFSVLIAGTGKDHDQLSNQIIKNKLTDKIKLIGFQEDLDSILQAADFVIMPSRQEGMPNVVMEGMALGRPVLAANVNGVPELMDHMKTGYIFEPLNIDAITEAIEFAIENHKSEKVANWCITAKEHIAQNFTIEKMLDKLEAYFHYQYSLENRK